jgi:antitoxin HicB
MPKETTKNLAYFMGLPYTYILHPDPDEGGYAIEVAELRGCLSQGDTAEEATVRIREAMELWLEVAIAQGDTIPEPGDGNAAGYSGRFNVRVPRRVHRELSQAAEREGVSLNLFVATALAEAVGRRAAGHGVTEANSPKPAARARRPREAANAVAESTPQTRASGH